MQTGRCECGGVSYVVDAQLRDVWNCHCEPCRRITGHHMAATAAEVDDVQFVSDESLRWYRRTETVDYGFCGTCGSSLFWRASDKPGHLSICAGTLDQPTGLRTAGILFASQVGDYHSLEPGVETTELDRVPKSGAPTPSSENS